MGELEIRELNSGVEDPAPTSTTKIANQRGTDNRTVFTQLTNLLLGILITNGGIIGRVAGAVVQLTGTAGQYLRSTGAAVAFSDFIVSADLNGLAFRLFNFEAFIKEETGATYTTVDADNGKAIFFNRATPQTVTIHQGAAVGFNFVAYQKGVGQVTFVAGGTGNIRNGSGFTKIANQYDAATIVVEANPGTSPEVYLAGALA